MPVFRNHPGYATVVATQRAISRWGKFAVSRFEHESYPADLYILRAGCIRDYLYHKRLKEMQK